MKRSKQEDVAIPITPMLDMAFQLLTFFILTYRPAPSEGQFSMNLLPSQAAATAESPAANPTDTDVPPGLKVLPTLLHANANGQLAMISVGGSEVEGIPAFTAEVHKILNDPDLAFDQTVIKADPKLKWAEVIKVVDVFLNSPKKMKNISLDELGPNDGG